MPSPKLKLVSNRSELLVSIDSRSWHVLDEPDLFPEGVQLRRAFGVTWAKGLYKEAPFGILHCLPAAQFQQACELGWSALLRDKDLLSYSYLYEFGNEKGVKHGGGMGGGFHVGGMVGSIKATPRGYCTLRLRSPEPDAFGRYPTVQVIDLRKLGQIETDDAGYLKVHRRKMDTDWYREMPRVLAFCSESATGNIEIRLV